MWRQSTIEGVHLGDHLAATKDLDVSMRDGVVVGVGGSSLELRGKLLGKVGQPLQLDLLGKPDVDDYYDLGDPMCKVYLRPGWSLQCLYNGTAATHLMMERKTARRTCACVSIF